MLRLSDAMQRARYAVAAAWLIAAVLSLAAVSGVFGTKLNDLLSNRFDLPGTESERALTLLATTSGSAPTRATRSCSRAGSRPPRRRRRCSARPASSPTPVWARSSPRAPASRSPRSTRASSPSPRHCASSGCAGRSGRGRRARLRQRPGRDQPRPAAGLRRRPAARRGDRDPDRGARAADRVRDATATLVPLLMAAGTVPVTLGLLWISRTS